LRAGPSMIQWLSRIFLTINLQAQSWSRCRNWTIRQVRQMIFWFIRLRCPELHSVRSEFKNNYRLRPGQDWAQTIKAHLFKVQSWVWTRYGFSKMVLKVKLVTSSLSRQATNLQQNLPQRQSLCRCLCQMSNAI
jgi:hypothetical protein